MKHSARTVDAAQAKRVPNAVAPSALEAVWALRDTHRMKEKITPKDFANFEQELHERVMAFERELVGAEMARLDVDVDAITIAGKVHRRVLRQSQTYMTASGEVVVERTLYKDRKDEEGQCVSPMELALGVVGNFWTQRAAQQALWVVTQMTPSKGAELFERVGNMKPSKSSLDRLPKLIESRWEENREEFEQSLRDGLQVPEGTVSIAVSLDGVLAPVDGGNRPKDVRARAAQAGTICKGPAGYREVGCATIAFCDEKGDLIGAVRMARAPEARKLRLKEMLAAEVKAIVARMPHLKVVKVADGANDNWDYLSSPALPDGEEVVDFFHATEHLHLALTAAHGESTRETRHRYEVLRDTLRDELDGAEKVIRALKYLVTKHPGKPSIARELAYFRKRKARMRYAELKSKGFMIGSGVVEAACKTLVSQRLKNSGMRWSAAGAQAILTPRGWDQSERFDQAWALVAATFHVDVAVLANVIAIKPKPPAPKPRSKASR